jgi:hypothetical protein
MIELGCAIFDDWRIPLIRLHTVMQSRGVSVQRIKLATMVMPPATTSGVGGSSWRAPQVSRRTNQQGPRNSRARFGFMGQMSAPRPVSSITKEGSPTPSGKEVWRGLYRQTGGSLRIGARYTTHVSHKMSFSEIRL